MRIRISFAQYGDSQSRFAYLVGIAYKPLVETMGLEPTTPCLQSRCSSQLSYVPKLVGTG